MKDKVRVLIVGGDEADRTAVQGALAANEIAAETTAAHELASAHDLERAAERLTGASLRIHAALSVAETLDLTAAEARELLAAHAAVTRLEAAGSERLESV